MLTLSLHKHRLRKGQGRAWWPSVGLEEGTHQTLTLPELDSFSQTERKQICFD